MTRTHVSSIDAYNALTKYFETLWTMMVKHL